MGMDLVEYPCQSTCSHQSVQTKSIFFMRKVVLNRFNEVKTMCKFKSGDSTNIGVAVKMKFDPKELPEKVSVGTGLKRQAETRN